MKLLGQPSQPLYPAAAACRLHVRCCTAGWLPVCVYVYMQLAFSAAVNAFLAASPNQVVTNTTVIAQALASNGLWLPCSTALFTTDASLQNFLADTLQSDPNLVFPTAAWGPVRTTNIKVVQPVMSGSLVYGWVAGDYSNCSTMCGGGSQTRQVGCMDNLGNPAEPMMCAAPAPANNRYACACACVRVEQRKAGQRHGAGYAPPWGQGRMCVVVLLACWQRLLRPKSCWN